MTQSVGLAIQGGAMRSIFCVGAVRGLLESNSLGSVKYIASASAGCIAALLFLGSRGNVDRFVESYSELLDRVVGRQFIDTRRLSRIVDVDYLVDVVLDVSCIDSLHLRQSDVFVEVVLTKPDATPEYFVLNHVCSDQELRNILTGTMAIPLLYPCQVEVDGSARYDGGIADPLPVIRAIEIGRVERIYGLCSVPPSQLGRPLSGRDALLTRIAPGVPRAVKNQVLTWNSLGVATDRLLRGSRMLGVDLVRVGPSSGDDLGSRLATDPRHLRRLERAGRTAGLAASSGRGEL